MIPRRAAFVAVAVTAGVVLAACGSGSASEQPERGAAAADSQGGDAPNLSKLTQEQNSSVGNNSTGYASFFYGCPSGRPTDSGSFNVVVCSAVSDSGLVGFAADGSVGPIAMTQILDTYSNPNIPTAKVNNSLNGATSAWAYVVTGYLNAKYPTKFAQKLTVNADSAYGAGLAGRSATVKIAQSGNAGGVGESSCEDVNAVIGCVSTRKNLDLPRGDDDDPFSKVMVVNFQNRLRTYPVQIKFYSMISTADGAGVKYTLANESDEAFTRDTNVPWGTADDIPPMTTTSPDDDGDPVSTTDPESKAIRAGYRHTSGTFIYRAELNGADGSHALLSINTKDTVMKPGVYDNWCKVDRIPSGGSQSLKCKVVVSGGAVQTIGVYMTNGGVSTG